MQLCFGNLTSQVVITASLIAVVYHNVWSQYVWPVAQVHSLHYCSTELASCSSWATRVMTINSIRSACCALSSCGTL